jgi:hypothetical protein
MFIFFQKAIHGISTAEEKKLMTCDGKIILSKIYDNQPTRRKGKLM